MTAMRETDFLICPICGERLHRTEHSFVCEGGTDKHHCFDISSSGYADLSYRSGGGGDPKVAVTDRTAFLDKGYYHPIAKCITDICAEYLPSDFLLIDAGCGEGYYSEQIAAHFPEAFVFGADLSKHAVHHASVRRNMRGGNNSFYSVASLFRLPVSTASADCLLSVFAPIAGREAERVLRRNGILIAAVAGERHLYQLKEAIYDSVHLNDDRADLPDRSLLAEKRSVSYMCRIEEHEDIIRLFGMTPYRFRTSESSMRALNELKSLNVEISVELYVYRLNLN